MKVKVIDTDIQLHELVVSIITPSLKDKNQNVEFSRTYHQTKDEAYGFINVPMYVNVKSCFYTVSKTAVISLDLINLSPIQKQTQDVQLEFLHHYIKFHPVHLKRMHENKAN